MYRFKNILIVLNEKNNEHALLRGHRLAKQNDARVTLIRPVGRLEQALETFKSLSTFGALKSSTLEHHSAEMERVARNWREDGIEVETRMPPGTPFIEVIHEVQRAGHDMVIATASESPKKTGSYFESLPLHLIRKCPTPVWVVSPTKRSRYNQILAAVDPQTFGDEEDSLSILTMDLATSLSRMDASRLHIAHAHNNLVIEGFQETILKFDGDERRRELKKCVKQAVAKRRAEFDTLMGRYPLNEIDHQIHFEEGEPDRLITSIARREEIDVIVMGTVSAGSAYGHWMGSTAENIINEIGCSVLTVKPEGFVSPIQLPAELNS
ncbi:MAG: universal stress protein [Verrucomicrobiota bacterium]